MHPLPETDMYRSGSEPQTLCTSGSHVSKELSRQLINHSVLSRYNIIIFLPLLLILPVPKLILLLPRLPAPLTYAPAAKTLSSKASVLIAKTPCPPSAAPAADSDPLLPRLLFA